jgi:hypothetical protein
MTLTDTLILGLGWLISLLLIVRLWLKVDGTFWKKCLWSFILLVPYLGAVFYGGLYTVPDPTPEGLRARDNTGSPGDDSHV